MYFFPLFRFLCRGGTPTAKMEVKTSLLDNMIGVGDMVLLEPLSEDSFLENLKNRFDHSEIYVSLFIQLTPLQVAVLDSRLHPQILLITRPYIP